MKKPTLDNYETYFAREMLHQGNCPECSNSPGYHATDNHKNRCELTTAQVEALVEEFNEQEAVKAAPVVPEIPEGGATDE